MLGLCALILQGLAPLCLGGMTAPADGSFIVICTAQGMQTIRVDGDGKPLSNAPAQDHQASPCLLCAHAHGPTGFVPPAHIALLVSTDVQTPLRAFSAEPVRSPHISYVSRAPPSAYA
jgi:hypothetical protein